MSFIQADSLLITGGTFTQHIPSVDNTKSVLETLLDKAAPAGFHDSAERGDPPQCHPETRRAVQNDIIGLVKAALTVCIIWLYGAAGAGKTAIAQTIAEKCDSLDKSQALLLGSFFFFRTSPLRNNIRRLGTSLAYQLARAIPSTLPYIAEHMKDNPAIFESNLKTQLITLFIQPLRRVCQDHPELCSQPRLIILDGLDELDKFNDQKHVIKVLNQVLQLCPIPLVVLIASRPEVHITVSFNSLEATEVEIRRIDLNTQYSAESDIRRYLQDAFSTIKRKSRFRPFLSDDWPARDDVEKVAYKSSGQFIFAATIVRYLDSDQHNPEKRLRQALDLSQRYTVKVKNSPFRELDALYMQIFSGVEERVVTLTVLHCQVRPDYLLKASGRFRPYSYKSLVTIEKHLQLSSGDVEEHLSALASLVKVNRGADELNFFHKSLTDFLLDKDRSFEFFVDQPSVHLFFLKHYLHHVYNDEVVSLPDALVSILRHLALVDPNNIELPGLITRFQASISMILKGAYKGDVHIHQAHYIDILHEISEILNGFCICDGFWEACVEAVTTVFLDLISRYPNRPGSSELLTAALYGASPFVFPPWELAQSLQIEQSTWIACVDVFDHVTVRAPRLQSLTRLLENRNGLPIAQRVLRNRHLSGVLCITDQIMVRTARLCVNVLARLISLNNQDLESRIDYPVSIFRPPNIANGRNEALWAAGILERMLADVPWDLALFEVLHQFKFDYYSHEFVGLADAISSYHRVHGTQASKERAARSSKIPEVLPPAGQRNRKAPPRTMHIGTQSASGPSLRISNIIFPFASHGRLSQHPLHEFHRQIWDCDEQ